MSKWDALNEAIETLRSMSIDDLTGLADVGVWQCPTCRNPLVDYQPLTYDELEKVSSWTLAQLVAWGALQRRSGIAAKELLAETSVQARPGIGGAFNPTVLGLNMNGIFVGIEPDGYTHS